MLFTVAECVKEEKNSKPFRPAFQFLILRECCVGFGDIYEGGFKVSFKDCRVSKGGVGCKSF